MIESMHVAAVRVSPDHVTTVKKNPSRQLSSLMYRAHCSCGWFSNVYSAKAVCYKTAESHVHTRRNRLEVWS